MNRRLERSYYVVVVIIIGLLVVLLSCSKNPTDSNDRGNPQYNTLLDGVTFEPSSGAPGMIVNMIGLDSLLADSGFSLTIGNEPAPLIAESGHTIRTAIPLYFDTTVASWPITPTGLQAVVLLYNGVPVDTALDAIGVDSLLPAPAGTMDSVLVKISTGATAIKDIALAIGAGDTLLMATCDAMDELLYTGTYSLTALLNGTAPVDGYDSGSVEIFTSLLVSSGLFDVIGRWSDTLVVTSRIAQQFSHESASQDFLTDEQLASRMQLHDFLAGFGSQVIGQTALQWQTVAAVSGAISLAAPVVGVYEFVVSWVLGELDFIVNKIAIAFLPSDVTRLDLDFYNHQINVGDTTEAIVRISAKNNPPNITPADIIGQVLGGLQLTQWINDRLGPTMARTLRQVIESIATWALGTITSYLSSIYNSPTSLDVSLPAKTWDSVWVHNPGLVDLIIPDQSRMSYITNSFNGQAKDLIGPIGLQMRTQPPGPSMYVNSILSSLGYAGGAFGDDLYTSNIDTVTVVGELALEVDFADVITVGGANVLGINAGYYDRNGTPHWVQDIEINISVTDGSADSTHGYTDAQGHFSSIIKIDSTADSVTVHIFAYGEYNSQTDTIVVAYSDRTDTLGNGWGIRCISEQGDKGSWAQAVGSFVIMATDGIAAHDEFNLLNVNNECARDYSTTPGKYSGAQNSRGTASIMSEARLSVISQSANPDYFQGFSSTGNCAASASWAIPADSTASLENTTVNARSETGTYINIYVDSGNYVLVYEGRLNANNSDGGLNSETFLSINATEINYTLDASTNTITFSDSLMLYAGNSYSIQVQTSSEGGRNDQSISGEVSSSSSYTLTCSIHRAPVQ